MTPTGLVGKKSRENLLVRETSAGGRGGTWEPCYSSSAFIFNPDLREKVSLRGLKGSKKRMSIHH